MLASDAERLARWPSENDVNVLELREVHLRHVFFANLPLVNTRNCLPFDVVAQCLASSRTSFYQTYVMKTRKVCPERQPASACEQLEGSMTPCLMAIQCRGISHVSAPRPTRLPDSGVRVPKLLARCQVSRRRPQ